MSATGVGAVLGAEAGGGGWLGALDPRLRLLAALAFALVVVSLRQVPALVAALGLALALARGSGLSWSELGRRLFVLEGFLAVLLLTLPFTVAGTPLLSLGPLETSREGLGRALVILIKANGVVVSLLGLLGGLGSVALGHALSGLGVPDKLAHLLLQTVRQIQLLHQEYRRLRQAMRARAFIPRADRHTWNSYGWLIGMLLVRSLDRSRRLMDAMRCRGFRGRLYLLDALSWSPRDTRHSALAAMALLALLALDRLP